MFIQTETTPNEASLKFIPGVPVMINGGTYEILDARGSLVSPLAVRLMGIEGITSVFYGPDFVTVSKDDTQPWSILKPEIFSILMEHFTSGKNLFKDDSGEMDGPQDTKILDTDSEVVAMIKELLDTRVRPAIQEDGGDIEFKGFEEEDGIVRLKLKGSCRGCSSSSVTLKSGIERMLTHYIPEVKTVEQVSILGARIPRASSISRSLAEFLIVVAGLGRRGNHRAERIQQAREASSSQKEQGRRRGRVSWKTSSYRLLALHLIHILHAQRRNVTIHVGLNEGDDQLVLYL